MTSRVQEKWGEHEDRAKV